MSPPTATAAQAGSQAHGHSAEVERVYVWDLVVRMTHWIIMLATFTILNLFVGIIVSTMQELAVLPDPGKENARTLALLTHIEEDLAQLRRQLASRE